MAEILPPKNCLILNKWKFCGKNLAKEPENKLESIKILSVKKMQRKTLGSGNPI